jgi:hypothetical protein
VHYGSHTTLLKRFKDGEAKVEGEEVTNLPDLSTNHGDFAVGTVRETKTLDGKSRQTVRLTHENNWLNFELDYDPETGEWGFHPSLADKLNELDVTPDCNGGKVTLERYDRDSNEYVALTEDQLDYLGLSDGEVGSVEPHPEGSDRGGYVPTLDAGPHYDEGGGEWQG